MSALHPSPRKTTLFYAVLISIVSLVVGMVVASRLDLSPISSAQTIAVPATNSAPLNGPIDATTFKNIAKAQSPMVVSVRTESRQRTQDLSEFFGGGNDLFERFFGLPQGPNQPQQRPPREQFTQAAGSGFIINRDGFILTNNHVVEGATKIEVQFFDDDDSYYAAKVVGRDPLTDSALIQLTEKPGRPLPEAKFGDSDQMQPGDWVMAIGNPFGLAHTISVGVISATSRSFPVAQQRRANVLQTDAAINPGNSGGPLLNIRGEVIGVNTAIYAGSNAGNIGIGFAIPINLVRDVLPGLNAGKVTRGRIGVQVTPVTPEVAEALNLRERRGALVATVTQGGPAAVAGLKAGDVIVEFNGRSVARSDDLPDVVGATKPGTVVPVKILRSGKDMTLNVRVEELDLDAEAGQRAGRSEPGDSQQDGGFGLTLNNLTPDMARRMNAPSGTRGAVVSDVDPGSPAARVLQPGDILLQVNQRDVANANEASAALRAVPSGRSVSLLIWRQGQEQIVFVRKP